MNNEHHDKEEEWKNTMFAFNTSGTSPIHHPSLVLLLSLRNRSNTTSARVPPTKRKGYSQLRPDGGWNHFLLLAQF
jgi:hypothetical protein